MPDITAPVSCRTALAALWRDAQLPVDALAQLQLLGDGDGDRDGGAAVLPSSFCVATAAQASQGAAALAAAELWHLCHPTAARLPVQLDRAHATLDCTAYFSIDGWVPPAWDPLSGLYPCGAALPGSATLPTSAGVSGGANLPTRAGGWVRIHANFAHHRDGVLRLLGLPPGPATPREAVAIALRGWAAQDFEQAAADAGLVVAALRSLAEWDAQPQAAAVAAQPLVAIEPIGCEQIGHAPIGLGQPAAPPLPWPASSPDQPPLHGLRVLDLTRILAGPVAGRLLAGFGADVLLVNAPHLPNIAAIADTSRGKRSCLIDLRQPAQRAQFNQLVDGCQVLLQGYRPGALAGHGYSAEALARQRPGIVVAELSAYGWTGPWAGRRGFDSLVQTATGFNLAEAAAAFSSTPQAMPAQILDYSAGHLLAFGIQAALLRQASQGGSWRVRVSLAGVGLWLRSLGRQPDGLAAQRPDITPLLQDSPSGFGHRGKPGLLRAVRPAARFPTLPAHAALPSMPPGSHAPQWLAPD